MESVRRADLSAGPIDTSEVAELVADRTAGAVVTFSGDVRDNDADRPVSRLEYEAHPGAAAVLAEVAGEVAARHLVIAIAVVHRVGTLEVGETALVAAVSAIHRAEAFAACSDLITTTKQRLPVWKHQIFSDGTDEWVNSA